MRRGCGVPNLSVDGRPPDVLGPCSAPSGTRPAISGLSGHAANVLYGAFGRDVLLRLAAAGL